LLAIAGFKQKIQNELDNGKCQGQRAQSGYAPLRKSQDNSMAAINGQDKSEGADSASIMGR